jgi:hypothetical protein
MRRKRAYRSSGLLRSLTLLRTFVIASAVILAAAIALSSTLSSDLRAAVLDDNARDVGTYVDQILEPSFVRGIASWSLVGAGGC